MTPQPSSPHPSRIPAWSHVPLGPGLLVICEAYAEQTTRRLGPSAVVLAESWRDGHAWTR